MKKVSKMVSTFLLAVILTFGFTSSTFATEKVNLNKIEAKVTESFEVSLDNNNLERVRIAEFDVDDLKVGDNEIYNDGETIISLRIEVPTDFNSIQPLIGGNSGWSEGWINDTATLYPSKEIGVNNLSYVLDWYNYKIDSVHSLDYKVGLGTVTDVLLDITRAIPGASYASAIGEVRYVITEFGVVVGSYNNWLRTDINSSGQVRTVWNY